MGSCTCRYDDSARIEDASHSKSVRSSSQGKNCSWYLRRMDFVAASPRPMRRPRVWPESDENSVHSKSTCRVIRSWLTFRTNGAGALDSEGIGRRRARSELFSQHQDTPSPSHPLPAFGGASHHTFDRAPPHMIAVPDACVAVSYSE